MIFWFRTIAMSPFDFLLVVADAASRVTVWVGRTWPHLFPRSHHRIPFDEC